MAGAIKFKAKWLFVLILFLGSCITVYDTINNRNYSKKYNPGINQLHPNYNIYQHSPNELRLYFQFYPKELAFAYSETDSIKYAFARLFFRVTKTYSSIDIVDSLTSTFTFKGNPRAHFTGFVPIDLPDNDNYVLEVFLTDLNSKAIVSQVLNIQKPKEGAGIAYMFMTKYASPKFHDYATVNDTFRVRTDMLGNKPIVVQQIKPDTILPIPPDISRKGFSFDRLEVDTSFRIDNIDTSLLAYDSKSIYVFNDIDLKTRKAIGIFGKDYPYVKTPVELLRPLAYLNSPREMEKLWAKKNTKLAVDSFWVDATKDLSKARELIRIYYNRVQLANYYFASYKEGWLTDRGMIYIVFGMPMVVTIEEKGENWSYGKGGDDDLNFYFYRDKHPVFGEYYQLSRSDQYSRIWFNVTSTWRSGRVFSINN